MPSARTARTPGVARGVPYLGQGGAAIGSVILTAWSARAASPPACATVSATAPAPVRRSRRRAVPGAPGAAGTPSRWHTPRTRRPSAPRAFRSGAGRGPGPTGGPARSRGRAVRRELSQPAAYVGGSSRTVLGSRCRVQTTSQASSPNAGTMKTAWTARKPYGSKAVERFHSACLPVASSSPATGSSTRRTRRRSPDSAAMPVSTVNGGVARPHQDQSQRHFLYRDCSHLAKPASSRELKELRRELTGLSPRCQGRAPWVRGEVVGSGSVNACRLCTSSSRIPGLCVLFQTRASNAGVSTSSMVRAVSRSR